MEFIDVDVIWPFAGLPAAVDRLALAGPGVPLSLSLSLSLSLGILATL